MNIENQCEKMQMATVPTIPKYQTMTRITQGKNQNRKNTNVHQATQLYTLRKRATPKRDKQKKQLLINNTQATNG